jgi:pimeloyl-ACP methyl ester carboxylesterase
MGVRDRGRATVRRDELGDDRVAAGNAKPERRSDTGLRDWLSMGAYGTWDILRRNPTLFAAGVSLSYGGDPSWAKPLVHMPIWAFHGSADSEVPVQSSRNMISALVGVGGTPWYTEVPGGGHFIWDSVYDNPALYAWLFAKSNKVVIPKRKAK